MYKTTANLADGRQIIYFDDGPGRGERTAVDTRELPEQAPHSEIRLDPLSGEWVGIAAHRQTRTYKPPADVCPLCPSAPGRPSEIPEPDYDVAVFENRFPSFATVVPEPETSTVPGMPDVPRAAGRGRCEVVCFTAEHSSSFAELSPSRVRTVVDALADRTAELSGLDGVQQVFPFENRGEEIGVTLAHPHGQVYGYPFVTPKTERMLDRAAAHERATGRALMGDLLAGERRSGARIIAESGSWTAFVPAAARWPVQVQLVPHRRVPDIPALSEREREEFAEVYLDVLRRLDGLYDARLPYIACWHQAPVHVGRELSWLYLEVFSVRRSADKLKYLAGSESGMAVWINDVTPEQIAEKLRAAG